MRLLPHSVVVCTSTHGAAPRAMTMSSFTSLTLSPTPLVTFNVAVPSRTLDAITASRAFNVHVLSGDEAGAALASRFTRGNSADGDALFEGVEWSRLPGSGDGETTKSPPLLKGEGVVHVLRCRVLDDAPHGGLMRVRDHVIVVGEVLGTVDGDGKAGLGLTYADRRYRRAGEELDVSRETVS
jgi:flavin reductase (DIM6/NTAB) family NADH-FMN oxidoreductase RutF